jgi:hypothetical protein
MNLFKKHRIIEIEGKFIAQTRKSFVCFWEGIEKKSFYLWYSIEYQLSFCSFNTLEEARQNLKKYKEFIKKPKIKYYYDNE